ncbi:UNVERIFIED_CONTAM: hypothetical protein PYX00_005858 [Menopon gallinae]|uniref:Uncharacterized protein n=1 Tax=Menopon gallinae TaxID=328185 RepID=A0AAW2HT57_9NEOP
MGRNEEIVRENDRRRPVGDRKLKRGRKTAVGREEYRFGRKDGPGQDRGWYAAGGSVYGNGRRSSRSEYRKMELDEDGFGRGRPQQNFFGNGRGNGGNAWKKNTGNGRVDGRGRERPECVWKREAAAKLVRERKEVVDNRGRRIPEAEQWTGRLRGHESLELNKNRGKYWRRRKEENDMEKVTGSAEKVMLYSQKKVVNKYAVFGESNGKCIRLFAGKRKQTTWKETPEVQRK